MSIRLAKSKDKALIISMVNEVYYSSEREFWSEGYFRISDRDFEDYIRNFATSFVEYELFVESGITEETIKEAGLSSCNLGISFPYYDLNEKLIGSRTKLDTRLPEVFGRRVFINDI